MLFHSKTWPSCAALLSAYATLTVSALDTESWKRQSIYQVLTDRFALTPGTFPSECNVTARSYCGGTWKGLASQLDYIQGMGFTALWISPVVANVEGPIGDATLVQEAYHGYWAQDIFSLNSHFGTKQDLKDLAAALHKRGMYLMVDVAPNHMGPQKGQERTVNVTSPAGKHNATTTNSSTTATTKVVSVDYSLYGKPFNKASAFHPYCPIDYNNETSIETCWQGTSDEHGATFALPDLRTEDATVASVLASWIADLVKEYEIDGLRIDAAKHMSPSFVSAFQRAAGVFGMGEYLVSDIAPYTSYLETLPGALALPIYYPRLRAFQSPSSTFTELAQALADFRAALPNKTAATGSLFDTHDNMRFASETGDLAAAKNAFVLGMLHDGIPVVYMGAEQHFSAADSPYNRAPFWNSPERVRYNKEAALYQWVARLNKVRTWVMGSKEGEAFVADQARVVDMSADAHTMAFKKGDMVAVVTNKGLASGVQNVTLPSTGSNATASADLKFTPSTRYIDVLTCTAFTSSSTGRLSFTLKRGMPRVFYPASLLSTSNGLCPLPDSPDTPDSPDSPDAPNSPEIPETREADAPTCVVTFEAEVATGFGEVVVLLGDAPTLGNGDYLQALSLDSSAFTADRPLWTVSAEVPLDTPVGFKLLITSYQEGYELRREKVDRKLVVDEKECSKGGGRVVVGLKYDKPTGGSGKGADVNVDVNPGLRRMTKVRRDMRNLKVGRVSWLR